MAFAPANASSPPIPTPVAAAPPLLVSSERCKGCELCITACPKSVLELDTAIVNRLGYHPVRLTDASRCTSCAICARVCPDAVFTIFAPLKEA